MLLLWVFKQPNESVDVQGGVMCLPYDQWVFVEVTGEGTGDGGRDNCDFVHSPDALVLLGRRPVADGGGMTKWVADHR